MIKKAIYIVSLLVFVLLISVYIVNSTRENVVNVENIAVVTNAPTSPKYISGVSSVMTPERVSVVTQEEKTESCVITKNTTMLTISTSSTPKVNDVVIVSYKDDTQSNPAAIILHRGIALNDFLGINDSQNALDPKVVIGTVESYVGSEMNVVLKDNTTKKIDTSSLSLFILNMAGLPTTITPTNRVDMNCEYKGGVWEASSVTVFE